MCFLSQVKFTGERQSDSTMEYAVKKKKDTEFLALAEPVIPFPSDSAVIAIDILKCFSSFETLALLTFWHCSYASLI